MALSNSDMLTLRVRISVPKGWATLSKKTRANTAVRVAAYADNLLECLGLPAKVAASFEQLASLPPDVIRIRTDHAESRVSPGGLCIADANTWTDADDAFMGIARALCCARELLLTDDLIERTWKKLPNSSRVRDAKLQRWLLQECVRYGFGTGLLSEVLSEKTVRVKNDKDARRLFEDSARAWPGTIRLWLSPSLYEQCYGKRQAGSASVDPAEGSFAGTMESVCDAVFHETGVHLAFMDPISHEEIEDNWFQLQLNDLPLPPTKGLDPDQFLVTCTPEELLDSGIEASRFHNPAGGAPVALVTGSEHRETVERLDHGAWGSTDYVGLHVANAARKNLGALYMPAKWLFNSVQLMLVMPELVDQVRKRWDMRDLVRVFRYLLDEEISIRDMRSILDFLVDSIDNVAFDPSKFIVFKLAGGTLLNESLLPDGRNVSPTSMGEMTRITMKRFIMHKYCRGGNTLALYLLDPGVEEKLSGPDFRGPLGPAAREYASRFLDAVRETVGFVAPRGEKPVILTAASLRRRIRELVRLEFPDLHVLSYQELSPDLDLRPIARIVVT